VVHSKILVLVSSSLSELEWLLPYLKTTDCCSLSILPLSRILSSLTSQKYPPTLLSGYFDHISVSYLSWPLVDSYLSFFIFKFFRFIPSKLASCISAIFRYISSLGDLSPDAIYVDFNGPSSVSLYLKFLFPRATIIFFPHGTQPQDHLSGCLPQALISPRPDLVGSKFLCHNILDYTYFASLYKLYSTPVVCGYPQYSRSWINLLSSVTHPISIPSISVANRKRILISFRPLDCSLISTAENLRLTSLVLDFLQSLPCVSVSVSIHPRDLGTDRYSYLYDNYPFLSHERRPAFVALGDCDIFISHYSSLLMDSIALSIPTLFVWPSSRAHTPFPSNSTRYCTEFGLQACESLPELSSAYSQAESRS